MKVGRVKFAVKEIKYKEKMEVDQTSILPVGDIQKAGEDFEEYEEVESIIDGKGEDDQSTPCDE